MSHPDYIRHLEQPNHYRNAESFIAFIHRRIIQRYSEVEITAVNQTIQDLDDFPSLFEAARLKQNSDAMQNLIQMDYTTDVYSAFATRVTVSLDSHDPQHINLATKDIHEAAYNAIGENIRDSGTLSDDKSIYKRHLEYEFKEFK